MTALLLAMPGNEAFAGLLARHLDLPLAKAEFRRFPDDESYVRLLSDVGGKSLAIVDTLVRPDDKILSLLFATGAAKALGAARVGLVAPYLAYMRQDRRFNPGEAVTSAHFARLLSQWVDWLVTVDPHLHRRTSLDEIYSIPSEVIHAAPLISDWIRHNVDEPVLVGPDQESEQWVSSVAKDAGAPYMVLTKIRHGDRDVEVSVPDTGSWQGHTPVLVDDIVSTGRTMIETIEALLRGGLSAPVCIGVHGVFAGSAYDDLGVAGAGRIATCNTIPHASNAVDLSGSIADALKAFL